MIDINYYIADLHLFHASVLKNGRFRERPFETLEEMHEAIRNNWNRKVTNADHVYVLGDLSMKGYNDNLISFLSQLRGNMHLILGNHDKLNDYRLKRLFVEVCDYKELTDHSGGKTYNLVLCHYPIFAWNGQCIGAIHLYGHVHDNIDDDLYQKAIANMDKEYKKRDGDRHVPLRAYNVGCMRWNYEPVTLKEILVKGESVC